MDKTTYFGMLPEQASKIAAEHDALFIFLVILSVVFFAIVVGAMVLFVFKYNAKKNPVIDNIHHNVPLEVIWTVIPTVILAVVFAWGFIVYKDMVVVPGNAYEINVVAKQWQWDFQYNEGIETQNELYVPANRPVRLVMTSQDVLHSFFLPAFRVKKDVVPGSYTDLWFEAEQPGEYKIYCAEYCGTAHSGMLGKVFALEPSAFEDWIAQNTAGGEEMTLEEKGQKLFSKYACAGCHSIDGSPLVGPSFKGVYGKTETLVSGTVQVDDTYIRKSVLEPQADIVKGFESTAPMPTFKGQLDDEQINALIAYIKSLK